VRARRRRRQPHRPARPLAVAWPGRVLAGPSRVTEHRFERAHPLYGGFAASVRSSYPQTEVAERTAGVLPPLRCRELPPGRPTGLGGELGLLGTRCPHCCSFPGRVPAPHRIRGAGDRAHLEVARGVTAARRHTPARACGGGGQARRAAAADRSAPARALVPSASSASCTASSAPSLGEPLRRYDRHVDRFQAGAPSISRCSAWIVAARIRCRQCSPDVVQHFDAVGQRPKQPWLGVVNGGCPVRRTQDVKNVTLHPVQRPRPVAGSTPALPADRATRTGPDRRDRAPDGQPPARCPGQRPIHCQHRASAQRRRQAHRDRRTRHLAGQSGRPGGPVRHHADWPRPAEDPSDGDEDQPDGDPTKRGLVGLERHRGRTALDTVI
jgi:hypothetical protein